MTIEAARLSRIDFQVGQNRVLKDMRRNREAASRIGPERHADRMLRRRDDKNVVAVQMQLQRFVREPVKPYVPPSEIRMIRRSAITWRSRIWKLKAYCILSAARPGLADRIGLIIPMVAPMPAHVPTLRRKCRRLRVVFIIRRVAACC